MFYATRGLGLLETLRWPRNPYMMPMMNPYMMPPLGAGMLPGLPGMPPGPGASLPSTAPPVAMPNMTAVMEIQNLAAKPIGQAWSFLIEKNMVFAMIPGISWLISR